MTQQFDLTFNTANTMDKMMTSSSYSNNQGSKTSADYGNQFSSYLDNANKSLSRDNKTSDTSERNKTQNYSNKNTKAENKTNYSDDKKVSDEKTSYKYDDEKIETKDEVVENKEVSNNENVEQNVQVVDDSLNQQEMDEMLKTSMLNANLTNNQVVSKEDVAQLEKSLAMSTSDDNELPMDAIKTGVQFEDKVLDTDVKDMTDVDMNAVETATKDVVASTETSLKSLYSSLKEKTNLKVVEENSENVQNVETDVKATNNAEIVSDVKVENNSDKVELLAKDNEDGKISVKLDDNKEEIIDVKEVKTEKVDTENDIVVKDEKSEKSEKVLDENDKNVDTKIVDEQVETPVNNLVENLNDEVKTTNAEQMVAVNMPKTEKVEVAKDQPADRLQTLNDEISSAKLENSANMTQQTDKKDVDENAKTNVVADETMNIKEDVSGIEFKNQKPVETTDEKVANSKVEDVKERVENVKMQVEDDVEISPQQQNSTDAQKVAKANETMEKAGLSTENLKKMDGKIKDVDYSSNNNAQTDLGQSSQEMMMRETIQETSQATQTTPEMKVDFSQALGKATHANAQQAQAQQEAQDVDILEQIRTRMNISGKNGMQKITIGLTPESLGKLNIEITKGQNGISAQILADNPQAKEILDKNLDGLKSVLQSQGVNVNNVNVKVAEVGRSSDSNNNMFQNEENQFDSNQREGNSRNSDDSQNREKHSEFEFMKNTVMGKELQDDTEEVISRVSQVEKTVSINGGLGKVNYKL